MPWMKVDDRFHSSEKINSIPKRQRFGAAGLWTIAGSWVAGQQTDGFVPDYMIRVWNPADSLVNALVGAGLWERESGGYRFVSWLKYNMSKEDFDAKRAASAERMARTRERRRNDSGPGSDADLSRNSSGSSRTSSDSAGQKGADKNVAPQQGNDVAPQQARTLHDDVAGVLQRPDPTRPDPTLRKKENPTKGKKERSPKSAYAEEFAEWYADYPRKRSRKQAEKAFAKARKDGVTVQELTDGLAKAKRSWQLEGRDSTKIPYPASWLNAEGWADEETTPQQTQPPSKAQQYLEIGQRLSQQAQQESDRQRQILEANRNATNPEDIIPPF